MNRCVEATGQQSSFLETMQAIASSLQGFANAIVYSFCVSTFRQLRIQADGNRSGAIREETPNKTPQRDAWRFCCSANAKCDLALFWGQVLHISFVFGTQLYKRAE